MTIESIYLASNTHFANSQVWYVVTAADLLNGYPLRNLREALHSLGDIHLSAIYLKICKFFKTLLEAMYV